MLFLTISHGMKRTDYKPYIHHFCYLNITPHIYFDLNNFKLFTPYEVKMMMCLLTLLSPSVPTQTGKSNERGRQCRPAHEHRTLISLQPKGNNVLYRVATLDDIIFRKQNQVLHLTHIIQEPTEELKKSIQLAVWKPKQLAQVVVCANMQLRGLLIRANMQMCMQQEGLN